MLLQDSNYAYRCVEKSNWAVLGHFICGIVIKERNFVAGEKFWFTIIKSESKEKVNKIVNAFSMKKMKKQNTMKVCTGIVLFVKGSDNLVTNYTCLNNTGTMQIIVNVVTTCARDSSASVVLKINVPSFPDSLFTFTYLFGFYNAASHVSTAHISNCKYIRFSMKSVFMFSCRIVWCTVIIQLTLELSCWTFFSG